MRKIFTLIMFCWTVCLSAQCPEFLNIDTSICSGGTVNITANASVLSTQLCGDSITILFDATGTTLAGDTNVYFHSSPELQVGEAWNGPTIGNWGQNDGVGRMTSVGTNLWAIRINPRTYYGYSVDSCLDGIWMVFRNFNGSVVTNNNGANILLLDNGGVLSSAFTPISGSTLTHNTNVTYLWSDNNTSSTRTFTGAVNLTVTATGVGGCTASGSVVIRAGTTAPVNLGNDIVRCTANTPVTLNAGNGYVTYKWLDGAPSSSSTYSAVNPGSYWVVATDAGGCTSSDTITITNSSVLGLSVPDSFSSCGNDTIRLNAATNINATGDSLTIVYNATEGQTGLVGAAKVYFHSSPMTYSPEGPWGDITIGNWGLDDGVGEMTSLGNNMWAITIDPRNYYLLSPDTQLLGIFMVFRNADGSQTGKAAGGANILLNLQGTTPTSTFNGITGTRSAAGPLTYAWSNQVSTPQDSFTSPGTYTIVVSDNHGCSASEAISVTAGQPVSVHLPADTSVCSDSILILSAGSGYASYVWNTGASTSFAYISTAGTYSVTVTDSSGCSGEGSVVVDTGQTPTVNLGHDTTDCSPVILNAGAGSAAYLWSTGSVTDTIVVTKPGTYTVTVTGSSGCKGTASVVIDSCAAIVVVGCGSPIANFSIESIDPGGTVTFKNGSHIAKVKTYTWNFGDGTTSNDTGSVVHTYASSGVYVVTLIVTDSCGGVDSITEDVDVAIAGIQAINGLTAFNLFPNPNNGAFNVQISLEQGQTLTLLLIDELGQILLTKKVELSVGTSIVSVDATILGAGIYTAELMSGNQKTFKKLIISR